MSIGIVNYNAGNLTSVISALNYVGASFFVSSDPDRLFKADRLIFPGVGEARYAMQQLKNTNCDVMLKEFALTKKPLLGICLGAQILFDYSEENDTPLLSILSGKVRRFNLQNQFKVPHMGWNSITYENKEYHKNTPIFNGINEHSSFYFVHSFYMDPLNKEICCASCNYAEDFCAACHYENIYALQFHPEKSAKEGLRILTNFTNL